jgi:hypothetical protein
MNIRFLSFLLLFWVSSLATVLAQETGLELLTIGPGTHALGLNEAVTAELLGASSLYSNPANLALENASSLNADYTLWIGDLTHTHAGVNLRKNNRAIAFGFMGSQVGDIPLRGNQPGPPNGTFNMSTLSISGGYAYRLGSLSVGATLQYLREEYYIYNASGYAGNVGASIQLWDERLRIGSSVINLGKMDELQNKSTTLPTLFKTGFTTQIFTFVPPKNQDLPISVNIKSDLVVPLQSAQQTTQGTPSDDIYVNIALEFTVAELIDIRTGYKTGDTVRPWSVGIGLNASEISANYAIIPFETGFGTVHSLGLKYRF